MSKTKAHQKTPPKSARSFFANRRYFFIFSAIIAFVIATVALATILISDQEGRDASAATFPDVQTSNVHFPGISFITDESVWHKSAPRPAVMSGFSDGNFRPAEDASGGAVAQVVRAGILGHVPTPSNLSSCGNVLGISPADNFYEEVGTLKCLGLFPYASFNAFTATRRNTATMIIDALHWCQDNATACNWQGAPIPTIMPPESAFPGFIDMPRTSENLNPYLTVQMCITNGFNPTEPTNNPWRPDNIVLRQELATMGTRSIQYRGNTPESTHLVNASNCTFKQPAQTQITKARVSGGSELGNIQTFQFTIQNTGDSGLIQFVLRENWPSQLTPSGNYTIVSGGGSLSNQTTDSVRWDGNSAAGGSVVISTTATVNAAIPAVTYNVVKACLPHHTGYPTCEVPPTTVCPTPSDPNVDCETLPPTAIPAPTPAPTPIPAPPTPTPTPVRPVPTLPRTGGEAFYTYLTILSFGIIAAILTIKIRRSKPKID